MLTKQQKIDEIRKFLGKESSRRGDELMFFCPKHYHHKAKLQVNVDTDLFHCWVCGYRGHSLKPLFKRDSHLLDQYEEIKHKEIKKAYEEVVLPAEYQFLNYSLNTRLAVIARNYIKERGLTDADIIKYKLGICHTGEYKNRLIIPSFSSTGELNFFVGRLIHGEDFLKYKHGKFDKNIIFNDLLVDFTQPTILTEGPFDAMVAGDNAIPIQGTSLSMSTILFKTIVESGKPVFLALDADAKAKQLKLANDFLKFGVGVGLIDVSSHNAKDVADLGRDRFRSVLNNTKIITDGMALVKERIRNENSSYK